jgi:hypothetical protein
MAHIRQQSDDGQTRTTHTVARGWTVVDGQGKVYPAGSMVNLTEAEVESQHYRLDPDPCPEKTNVAPLGGGIPKAKNAEERAQERAEEDAMRKAAKDKAGKRREA